MAFERRCCCCYSVTCVNAVVLSAVDMSVIQRVLSECTSFARQFRLCVLVKQPSSVVDRGCDIASCRSMASPGIESDTGENKDNVQKRLKDGDDQLSAKRIKTSDSNLENAVGVVCSKFWLITVFVVYKRDPWR